jgi:hypothetical protein
VDKHRLAWNLVMAALTIVYVFFAFREDRSSRVDDIAVWSLAVVFLIEFGARFYDSPDRAVYLRTHWLDLITAVPIPGVPGLRVIRLLRLLRFLKIGVFVRRSLVGRGWNEMGLLWPTMVLFWVASAFALWLVEHDAPGTGITTFSEAMTASFLTAATLGFGKHALPITLDGQIIAALIVFFALGLWGFASSQLTQMWLHGRRDDASNREGDVRQELVAIKQQLELLTDAVAQSNSASVRSTESTSGAKARRLRVSPTRSR